MDKLNEIVTQQVNAAVDQATWDWLRDLPEILAVARQLVHEERTDWNEDTTLVWENEQYTVELKDGVGVFALEIFENVQSDEATEDGGVDLDNPLFSITVRRDPAWLEALRKVTHGTRA